MQKAHCKVATSIMPLVQTNLADKDVHITFGPSLVNNMNLYLFFMKSRKLKSKSLIIPRYK